MTPNNTEPETGELTAKQLGFIGEETAARYLIDSGFTLLERNWRTQHLEVDIVAEWHGTIVFVEVKSRKEGSLRTPESAVNATKRARLIRAARQYINTHYYKNPRPYRFDIITVIVKGRKCSLTHIRNAFRTKY